MSSDTETIKYLPTFHRGKPFAQWEYEFRNFHETKDCGEVLREERPVSILVGAPGVINGRLAFIQEYDKADRKAAAYIVMALSGFLEGQNTTRNVQQQADALPGTQARRMMNELRERFAPEDIRSGQNYRKVLTGLKINYPPDQLNK
jgi:hypothetical protein